MENKINIAELLKDCPRGMKLDCIMFDDVVFENVDLDLPSPIVLKRLKLDTRFYVNKYGHYYDARDSKCIIFPKGKTTWEGFHRPFKEGDVIVDEEGSIILYKQIHEFYEIPCVDYHCRIYQGKKHLFHTNFSKGSLAHCGNIELARFATKEEKQKLFDAIEENYYRWNEKTKTLEQVVVNFNIGDKIKRRNVDCASIATVTDFDGECYTCVDEKGDYICFYQNQTEFELVSDKFDITTLNPFDKVLVRSCDEAEWKADLFSHYKKYETFTHCYCVGDWYEQ